MKTFIDSIQCVLFTWIFSLLHNYSTNSCWLLIFRWYIFSMNIIFLSTDFCQSSFFMTRKCLKNFVLKILRCIYIWSKMYFTLINFYNRTKIWLINQVFYWLIIGIFLDSFWRIVLSLDISNNRFFIWSLRDLSLIWIHWSCFEVISCLWNKSLLRPHYSLMKRKSGWFRGSFFCCRRSLNLILVNSSNIRIIWLLNLISFKIFRLFIFFIRLLFSLRRP